MKHAIKAEEDGQEEGNRVHDEDDVLRSDENEEDVALKPSHTTRSDEYKGNKLQNASISTTDQSKTNDVEDEAHENPEIEIKLQDQ